MIIGRYPSRNHRWKGIKVKHVLQIILFLGVCFWLIFQVKHSHDKTKEFNDENDAELPVQTQSAHKIAKLGRKGLHPVKDKVNQNQKPDEEVKDEDIIEDDQIKHEHDGQQEGNGLENGVKEDGEHAVEGEKEQEDDDNKSEEMDNEGEGGDYYEIDDQEIDSYHDDALMEEASEQVKESEDEEKDGSVENHNSHEARAREEHYKGDDASSAVTLDDFTHTTSTGNEAISFENSYEYLESSMMESESKTNYTEESNSDKNLTDSDVKVTETELTGWTSSNATSGKEAANNSLSKSVDSSQLNTTTATTHSSSNLTELIPLGASNNMTGTNAVTQSEQSKMVKFSESNHAQNDTVNMMVTGDVKNVQTEEGSEQVCNSRVSEENLPDSNSPAPVKGENGDAAAGELEINKAQNNNWHMKENTDTITGGETDESSDSSPANGTSDSVDHHATDSSSYSHILKDVTKVQTDLDIRNGGDSSDETATE